MIYKSNTAVDTFSMKHFSLRLSWNISHQSKGLHNVCRLNTSLTVNQQNEPLWLIPPNSLGRKAAINRLNLCKLSSFDLVAADIYGPGAAGASTPYLCRRSRRADGRRIQARHADGDSKFYCCLPCRVDHGLCRSRRRRLTTHCP